MSRFVVTCLPLVCLALFGSAHNLRGAQIIVGTADELRTAAARAAPGDVIQLAAGEWRDVDLVIESRGTAAAPITLAAERPGEVVITGRSRMRLAGEYLIVSGLRFERAHHPDAVLEFRRDSRRTASHCRVTECAFLDCNPSDPTRDDCKYVSLYGADNRIDHCELTGKRTRGTTLVVWLTDETNGGHRIDANYFGPRPELQRNGGETIRMGDSATSLLAARCVVEGNLFEECDGEAEIISNKSCENIYRHNTFRRCSGALTLRHGDRCTVEGNWFLGAGARGSGGVRIIGTGHRVINNYFEGLTGDDTRAGISLMTGIQNGPLNGYAPVVGAVIAHNTLVDCRQPLLIGLTDDDVSATVAPRDCVVSNNVIVGRRGPLCTVRGAALGLRGRGNLLFGAETGLPDGMEARVVDPLLARDPDGWSRPQSGSPVRGAAVPDGFDLSDDIEGQPRGERPDVGCDQASSEPSRYRPLERRDVGPAWR